MGDDHQAPGQQAQSDQPLFSVVEAVIFERDARPGKDLLGILEAEAMLSEVLPILRIVSFVFHFRLILQCNSFCSYTQIGGGVGGVGPPPPHDLGK